MIKNIRFCTLVLIVLCQKLAEKLRENKGNAASATAVSECKLDLWLYCKLIRGEGCQNNTMFHQSDGYKEIITLPSEVPSNS